MVALEAKDLEMQLESLLEKYERIDSENARVIIEDCISSHLGYMQQMMIRGDIPKEDYEHCKKLIYLVTAKKIEPTPINETKEEKEERVIKGALDRYARTYKKENNIDKRNGIIVDVRGCLEMLVPESFDKYWNYFEDKKG